MNKAAQYLLLIILNGIIVFVLLFFHFMMFSFLPAISPNTQLSDQKSIAINFAFKKSAILILELAIGLILSFLINKKIIKLSLARNICVLTIEFIIVVISIIVFSLNYINKFG